MNLTPQYVLYYLYKISNQYYIFIDEKLINKISLLLVVMLLSVMI